MQHHIHPDERHELFTSLGKAVWYLQYVEDALHTFLTVKVDIKTPGAVTLEQGKQQLEKNRRSTLGTTLRIAREQHLLSVELQTCLDVFKEERDWLVHRSLSQHGDDLYAPEKRASLLARIADFSRNARQLHKLIYAEAEVFAAGQGISQEWIQHEAEQSLQRLHGEES